MLYYTQEITADVGFHSVPVTETIFVEPGLILGVHRDSNQKIGIAVLKYVEDTTLIYTENHDETLWQPRILHTSNLTNATTSNKRPSLGVQITPVFPYTGNVKSKDNAHNSKSKLTHLFQTKWHIHNFKQIS